MDEDEEFRVEAAYHEAGHVAASLVLGAEFSYVEVYPLIEWEERGFAGIVQRNRLASGWLDGDDEIVFSLAGPIAEAIYSTGLSSVDSYQFGAESDIASVVRELHRLELTLDSKEYAHMYRRAEGLVFKHWVKIERIAERLLASEEGALSYAEAASAFAGEELTYDQAVERYARLYNYLDIGLIQARFQYLMR